MLSSANNTKAAIYWCKCSSKLLVNRWYWLVSAQPMSWHIANCVCYSRNSAILVPPWLLILLIKVIKSSSPSSSSYIDLFMKELLIQTMSFNFIISTHSKRKCNRYCLECKGQLQCNSKVVIACNEHDRREDRGYLHGKVTSWQKSMSKLLARFQITSIVQNTESQVKLAS